MDVALIQWPSDEALRLELARLNQPRLLLVEPDAPPPDVLDALEDWVRLPVSRVDRTARVKTLEARVDRSGVLPSLTSEGIIEYRGSRTQLSEIQTALVRPLLDQFGTVISREALTAAAWPNADASNNNLDVSMGRLRRQLLTVGIRVRTVRSRGYYLSDLVDRTGRRV